MLFFLHSVLHNFLPFYLRRNKEDFAFNMNLSKIELLYLQIHQVLISAQQNMLLMDKNEPLYQHLFFFT